MFLICQTENHFCLRTYRFLQLGKLLACAFFVCEHAFQVGHELIEFVHEVCLHTGQIMQASLLVQFLVYLAQILINQSA